MLGFLKAIQCGRMESSERQGAFRKCKMGYNNAVAVGRVNLVVQSDRIELEGFVEGSTLHDLVQSIEDFRLDSNLKVKACAGCAECCKEPIPVIGSDLCNLKVAMALSDERDVVKHLVIPEYRPSAHERRIAAKKLSVESKMPIVQAQRMYDFNNGDPIVLERTTEGHCRFLKDRFCSIYEQRPLTCRLYLCQMGDRLSVVQENVNRQGLWYLYQRLGWIDREDIADNPFAGTRCWEEALLSDFDCDESAFSEDLFFYF